MKSLQNIQTTAGWQFLPGIHKIGDGYNFTMEAPERSEVFLLLYHRNSTEPAMEIPLDEKTRSGRVRSIRISGIELSELEYNYKIDGEIVQDKTAHTIVGRETFGEPFDPDPHKIRCRYTSGAEYDWEEDASPDFSFEDMILYKLHVRGYTKAPGSPVRKKGTLSGLMEMIPYFQELGVNTIELMPVYEFTEVTPDVKSHGLITHRKDSAKVNFWGYISGFYYAPKRAYCATDDPEKEMKDLVKKLHRSGMKCILEFYFPAEINPSRALKALQFWKLNYHIDGFHVKGDGLPLKLILKDGILSDTMLLLPSVPTEYLSKEQGRIRTVAEMNAGFMEDMRRFLKSDEGMVENAMWRTRRNAPDHGVINYMACQDGFTLMDMVTYNYRHNEANGQENQDGSSFNYSWNCGVEGPSRKTVVRKTREKQLRNAVFMLMLSQGTPMIYAGDEFGNSQDGNNNAWCQDNPTGWVDWKSFKRQQKLFEFVKKAIAFRQEHPILHMRDELRGTDYLGKGFPDVSYHGERAWYVDKDNTCRMFGAFYYGGYGRDTKKSDARREYSPGDFLYIAYNFHWEERSFALPSLPEGIVWKKAADTALPWESCFDAQTDEYVKEVELAPRSIVILMGSVSLKPEKKSRIEKNGNLREEEEKQETAVPAPEEDKK